MRFKLFLQSIVISVFVLTSFASYRLVHADFANQELKPCVIDIKFLVNGNPITGTVILRDSKNKYQLKIDIKQPDNTTCQPAFFWKISSQEYVPSPDPNEPTEIPPGKLMDSGQIVSNLEYTKTIDLGTAALKTYAYTLFIARDKDFSSSVFTKAVSVSFTDDPKQATNKPPATTPKDTKPTDTKPTTTGPVPKVFKPYVDAIGNSLTIDNPSNEEDVTGIVAKIINWLLLIVAMLSAVMIIYAGLLLIFNGGDESRAAKGKTTLIWAVIGMVVALGAFAIVNIIQGLLG